MADENCIQLEMNFNGSEGNRMKEHLDEGTFQVFVELNTPSADTKVEDAAARVQEMEYMTLARRDLACALAFTDAGRRKTPETSAAIPPPAAAKLPQMSLRRQTRKLRHRRVLPHAEFRQKKRPHFSGVRIGMPSEILPRRTRVTERSIPAEG